MIEKGSKVCVGDKGIRGWIGQEDQYRGWLGEKLVWRNIPARSGRNLEVIVESAAVNYRQKKMGYNAAQELYNRVQANIAKRGE